MKIIQSKKRVFFVVVPLKHTHFWWEICPQNMPEKFLISSEMRIKRNFKHNTQSSAEEVRVAIYVKHQDPEIFSRSM